MGPPRVHGRARLTGTLAQNDGSLVLTATPNMRQVREFIEQALLAADDINAIEEGL